MKKVLVAIIALMMLVMSLGLASAAEGELVLHRAYGAPHGTRGFSRTVVATVGDVIVGVAMDEFQYNGKDENVVGVPNSDQGFGEQIQF